jgi:uncharacterized protein (TIGR02246 family)
MIRPRRFATLPVAATVVALLAVAAASASAGEGPAGGSVEEARAEVAALLAAQAAAWSRGDLDAFTAVYAADAAFVSPTGLTRGRDEVLARYRRRYPDRAAMGRLTLEVIEARPVACAQGAEAAAGGAPGAHSAAGGPGAVGAVSVVARWTLGFPDDPARETATGLTLLVFHRRAAGGWEIVQDASM